MNFRDPQLSDKPSIAVLPFDNMSGDPEQEYFADGIAEDIITSLSKISGLFVVARFPVIARKFPVTPINFPVTILREFVTNALI